MGTSVPLSGAVLPRELNDTVVRELYEASAGLVPWPKALDGLFAELKVRQMQLLTVDKTNGTLVRSDQPAHMDSIVFDAILEYVREYHRFDPHLAYTGSMPVGAVVNTANLFPIEEYKKHPFYRDYWAAFDVRELLAAKVAEDERYVVMLGMSRTHDLPAYTPADTALLARYVGHLAAAYRIVKHLGVIQATAQAGLAIIEASARPMVLLGLNRQIIAANSLARQFLASDGLLFEKDEILCCRGSKASAELQRAFEALQLAELTGSQEGTPRRIALRLQGSKIRDHHLLCSIWAMQPAMSMNAFGPMPVALLTIAPRTSKEFADPVFIGSMFDLTPAEAKIAIALLHGGDLRGIAAAQRVSLETVRTQLKSVFAKTDTSRQADLIALLMRVTSH
jgi:DNA-binding CsgD family transcriptional regulator